MGLLKHLTSHSAAVPYTLRFSPDDVIGSQLSEPLVPKQVDEQQSNNGPKQSAFEAYDAARVKLDLKRSAAERACTRLEKEEAIAGEDRRSPAMRQAYNTFMYAMEDYKEAITEADDCRDRIKGWRALVLKAGEMLRLRVVDLSDYPAES